MTVIAQASARTILRLMFAGVVSTLLSACDVEKSRVYTVEEFMADEERLARAISRCRANPGELRSTPNCMNAEAADGKARLKRMKKALGG